jgi:hypothetical protein
MPSWETLPWGRHKGENIRDIDPRYLEWYLKRTRISTSFGLGLAIKRLLRQRLRDSWGEAWGL